ncbi:MAG: hypothetical protein VKJ24_09810 [Synechococcales bacterium]|nr:hypothetical protein [Synechococcales bacterium]
MIGLVFRNTLTPLADLTNEITASSEFSVNGNVQVNQVGTDLNSGLTELPTDLVDASQKVSDRCRAKQGSSFVMTGRGGIIQDPAEKIMVTSVWSDIRRLASEQDMGAASATLPATTGHTQPHASLVEATELQRDPQGAIALVTSIPAAIALSPTTMTCGSETTASR